MPMNNLIVEPLMVALARSNDDEDDDNNSIDVMISIVLRAESFIKRNSNDDA